MSLSLYLLKGKNSPFFSFRPSLSLLLFHYAKIKYFQDIFWTFPQFLQKVDNKNNIEI